MAPILNNQRGQTSLEYLLLLAATFIAAYIVMTGPIATFTTQLLTNIRLGLFNLIVAAEWPPSTRSTAQDPNKEVINVKPLHL